MFIKTNTVSLSARDHNICCTSKCITVENMLLLGPEDRSLRELSIVLSDNTYWVKVIQEHGVQVYYRS